RSGFYCKERCRMPEAVWSYSLSFNPCELQVVIYTLPYSTCRNSLFLCPISYTPKKRLVFFGLSSSLKITLNHLLSLGRQYYIFVFFVFTFSLNEYYLFSAFYPYVPHVCPYDFYFTQPASYHKVYHRPVPRSYRGGCINRAEHRLYLIGRQGCSEMFLRSSASLYSFCGVLDNHSL